MSELESTEQPLPDPDQFGAARQAIDHAAHAAFQARRMLAASLMEPVMGCGAGVLSAAGSAGLLFEQSPGHVVGALWWLIIGWWFLLWGGWILWSMRHRRKTDAMFAVDRETACRARNLRPLNFIASSLCVVAMFCFWQWAFPRMSPQAIVLVIGSSMAAFAAWFVVRFCQLHLAEDLVFAAAIAVPWGLYLARTPNSAVFGVIASTSALGAVWSLRSRWKRFASMGNGSEAVSETPVHP
ncbi:MAG TPA: hypothetical protein VHB77_02225 [Planctomycetaceae bacterium]|nr:hypothetical protein [Planctomycetaceae bacterium]